MITLLNLLLSALVERLILMVVMIVWMLEHGREIGLVIFMSRMPTICFEVII